MVKHSTVHGFEIPEGVDSPETAAAAITQFLEKIDRLVALRGHETRRPDAGQRGRLFLDTSASPPTLSWDRGDSWRSVAGDYEIPPNLARTDQDVTFTGNTEFTNPIEADISGKAASADEAEHAHQADEAQDFAGEASIDDMVRADKNETIEEQWTHEQRQTFEEGVNVTGGTLDLPQYDGADPPTSDRDQPGLWIRLDHQPQQ